ncbi:MAG TPA: hypothetical protein VMZ90_01860 [Vicinamibacterales bacterium]|nr:hypothetical protein [Vicinamibacterales bacterium]
MRNLPGWILGTLGVVVVAGAFFLGGRLNASDMARTPAATVASTPASGLQVECEPGQRAVVRQAATVNPGPATVACVGAGTLQTAQAVPVGYNTAAAYPASQYVTQPYVAPRPAARPYIAPAPRMVRTSSVRTVSDAPIYRAPAPRVRSTKRSVAIIAGGTAAGAIIGGLTKGKKGALIGGLIGGGAATVYDRTTRKKNQ